MAQFSEVGIYRLKERIGRGGMAEVFRAEDPRTQRDVAVKIIGAEIADDEIFRKRFAQEIKLIAKLEHSAIVPLYDVGEADGRPYLVMRYMPNGSLAERIEKRPMPLADASRLVTRIAAALDFAHSHGIIHRDLKPANILLDRHDDPQISDFGIAKIVGQSGATLSRTGMTMGTPAYMSPEQFRGETELDGRADIYALGVLLFQMLSGKLPFNSDTPHGLMYHHLESPVPDIRTLNPELPPDLHLVLQQALAKQPGSRYSTAGDFATDLESITEGRAITPLPTTSARQLLTVPLATRPPRNATELPVKPKKQRGQAGWFALAGAALLVVGILTVYPRLFNTGTATVAGQAPNEFGLHEEPILSASVTVAVPTREPQATQPPAPTESTVESPVAVLELIPSDSDFVIFDDELEFDFENWSWAPSALDGEGPIYEGSVSVWVEFAGKYDAAWVINPTGAVETQEYAALRFAIHGGDEGRQVMVIGAGNSDLFPDVNRVALNDYLPGGPVRDAWREVTIPLADLHMENDTLFSVSFQNDLEEAQPEFYIDDIRLIVKP